MKFKSMKRRFTATVAIVYIVIAALTYVAFHLVTTKIVRNIGTDFAAQQAQLDKLKLLSTIQHDLSLSLRMSQSPLLKQWALDENNPRLKKPALLELESYRAGFKGQSLTFVPDRTKHYYFHDGKNGGFPGQPRRTLKPGNEDDSWYFRVMREVDRLELNVDYDEHLDMTRVWFNVVIKDDNNRKIGVGGSSIDLTEFINDAVTSNGAGVETILFNRDGAIVGHRDKSYLLHNSKARGNEKKTTIFDLISGDADRENLKNSIDSLLKDGRKTENLQLAIGGRHYLAAASYLQEIQWFTLVLVDKTHVVGNRDFLPVIATTIVSLLAILIIIGLLLNRIVLAPLSNLAASARQIAKGDFNIALPPCSDDEVGALTSSFYDMAKMVKDHTNNLEQMVNDRTGRLEDTNFKLQTLNKELIIRRKEAETALTERVLAQEKMLKLFRAVENSPATVVITDCDGNIEYVNPKFTQITGYGSEEAIGKNPRILKAGVQSREFYQELWETILSGNEWRGEFCNKKKDGSIYWEHASISPIRDEKGSIVHFVAVKEDVTERKRVAEELQNARDAADAANKLKSEFLANMSHEIRTPLNAIIGFSALALESGLPPQHYDYANKINTAGKALLGIINDILDFSKIEAGKLEIERVAFSMEETIATAFSIVQQKALEKNIGLNLDLPGELSGHFIGDPLRLGQVITNLMNNAIKFTEKGEVRLDIALLEQERDELKLQFSVRDTGIGLSPDSLAKLFQPFTQADGSTTRKFGGTGLGLSISKQLVEMMGGVIWAESEPSSGSVFSFTAWFGAVADGAGHNEAHQAPEREPEYDFTGLRFLLAEDNEVNQQLATILLTGAGAMVDVAVNGREAVNMALEGDRAFDMVLMDVQMPGMDGYKATRLIRADARFRSLPIIAMTAHAMAEERQKILSAGMNDHITKPIDSRVMFRTISRHLQRPLAPKGKNAPHAIAIPAIPGLDIAGALARIDGNMELYLLLLRVFLDNQSDTANIIRKALNEGDRELAERSAHTARGVAGNIGAPHLEKASATLEKAIRANEPAETTGAALNCFAEALDQLVQALKAELPAATEGESAAPAASPVDMNGRRTVLIVDDAEENIAVLNAALQEEYLVKAASRGEKAIEIARSMPVDIILLDVMMPEMDGFETCRRLKSDPLTRRIPVIFLTARGEVEDESVGFSCGGIDYITKPVRSPIVRTRLKNHLALYDQKRCLEDLVRERTTELTETQLEILNRLCMAAEYRDNETGMHVARVCRYSRLIALEYGLPEAEADLLFNAAPMHDVGKIGIPDNILLKSGKLADDEWEIIRSHCIIGHKIIGSHKSDLLTAAATIALTHHEKWDGSGYPSGLSGAGIPIFSRIIAVADVFDALTSKRPYKNPWPVDEAISEIKACSGQHFDPDVTLAFLRCIGEILEIKDQFSDKIEPDEIRQQEKLL